MSNYRNTMIKNGLLLSSSLLLVSCSLFSSKDGLETIDDSYMSSEQAKTLDLPEGTTELTIEDGYRVPEGLVITSREAQGKKLSLEPPHLLLIGGNGVREDASMSNPTVWVRNTEDELAAFLSSFVEEKMISVISKDSRSIATDWIATEDESPLAQHLGTYNIDEQRHKFLVSILGETNNEVGIQVQHLAGEYYLEDQWKTAPQSAIVAKQFLNYFIGYYDAARTEQAKSRILEENTIDIALGLNAQGEMALVTEKDFQTVWQQIPKAFEKLQLSTNDRDQSTGNYYFSVGDEDSGFWSGLFGSDESVTGLPKGDYVMKVKKDGEQVSLTFFDNADKLLSSGQMSKLYPEVKAAFRSQK